MDNKKKVDMAITPGTHPEAWQLAVAIVALSAQFDADREAITTAAKRQLAQLGDEMASNHRALWAQLEAALGLQSEISYALIQNFMETHQIAFVQEEGATEESTPRRGGPGGKIAELIAQALGGSVVSANDTGGVIAVETDSDD